MNIVDTSMNRALRLKHLHSSILGLLAFAVCSLSLHAQLKVDAGPDVFVCEGFASKIGATYKGGTPPIRFQWSPAIGLNDATSQTPIVNPVQALTQYVVTSTDATGAVSVDTVLVTKNPGIVADAGVDIQGCVGAMVTLGGKLVASGGTGPYKYQWLYLPANASSSADANPTFVPTRSGYARYVLHVMDAVGCDSWDTIEVQVNQPMSVAIGTSGAEACAFSPHSLGGLGITSGGTAPYRFKWTPERGLSSPIISNPTAFPDTTTMYTLTVTDALGCAKSDSVLVRVKPRIRTKLTKTFTVCPKTRVELADSSFVSGGTGPYTYKWSSLPTQFISNDSIANPYTIPDDKYSGQALFTVDITDALGCSIRDTVFVNVTQAPSAYFRTTPTVCQNDTVDYGVTGADFYQYKWTIVGGDPIGPINRQNVRVRWTQAGFGKIDLVVYDPVSNCTSSGTNTTIVNPNPTPKITVNGVTTICTGSGVTTILDAGPGYVQYRWSSGETTQKIIVTHGGDYVVFVRDANGCRNKSEPVRILEVSPPKPVISGPLKICGGVKAQLHATPGFRQYAWNTGETDSVITITGPGNYSVMVSDTIGCTGVSEVYTVVPRPIMVSTGGDPNFDAVETGLSYPPKEVFYKNTTTEDLVIDSLVMLTTNVDIVIKSLRVGSTTIAPSAIHGLRVQPGQELTIELEYNPTIKDVNTYELLLSVVSPCEDKVSIKGNLASYDKTIWGTASIPATSAKPGDRFSFPLWIQFDSPQDSVEDATLFINLRVNGYMMDIVDDAGGSIVSIDTLANSWKVLHFRFDHLTIKYSSPFLLTNVNALALASRKLIDTIFVDDRSVRWEQGSVFLKKPRVRTRNGMLTLETYCFPHDLVYAPGGLTQMHVSPNPVVEDLNVYINSAEEQLMRIELFAPDGRLLKTETLDATAGSQLLRMDVSDISAGVYPLVLHSAQGSRTQHVVICK